MVITTREAIVASFDAPSKLSAAGSPELSMRCVSGESPETGSSTGLDSSGYSIGTPLRRQIPRSATPTGRASPVARGLFPRPPSPGLARAATPTHRRRVATSSPATIVEDLDSDSDFFVRGDGERLLKGGALELGGAAVFGLLVATARSTALRVCDDTAGEAARELPVRDVSRAGPRAFAVAGTTLVAPSEAAADGWLAALGAAAAPPPAAEAARAIAAVEWTLDAAAEATLAGAVVKLGFLEQNGERGFYGLAPTTFDDDGVYVGPAIRRYDRGDPNSPRAVVDAHLLDGCVAVAADGDAFRVDFPPAVAAPLTFRACSAADAETWALRCRAVVDRHYDVGAALRDGGLGHKPRRRRDAVVALRRGGTARPPAPPAGLL